MRDFTLKAYRDYLTALQSGGYQFIRFDQYISTSDQLPEKICMLRHDVDRKPQNALKMGKVEKELGVVASYYFRMKPCSFNKEIIRSLVAMGHEVGYHYETMSDTYGNKEQAYNLFEGNLRDMREICQVSTACMHGRPFSKYDNRDLWKDPKYHQKLIDELDLLGELYLDIDYSDIAYISDTGRNWTSSRSNVRDKVNSNVTPDFTSGEQLLTWFKNDPVSKVVFQVHPERWSDTTFEWFYNKSLDTAINFAKALLR